MFERSLSSKIKETETFQVYAQTVYPVFPACRFIHLLTRYYTIRTMLSTFSVMVRPAHAIQELRKLLWRVVLMFSNFSGSFANSLIDILVTLAATEKCLQNPYKALKGLIRPHDQSLRKLLISPLRPSPNIFWAFFWNFLAL